MEKEDLGSTIAKESQFGLSKSNIFGNTIASMLKTENDEDKDFKKEEGEGVSFNGDESSISSFLDDTNIKSQKSDEKTMNTSKILRGLEPIAEEKKDNPSKQQIEEKIFKKVLNDNSDDLIAETPKFQEISQESVENQNQSILGLNAEKNKIVPSQEEFLSNLNRKKKIKQSAKKLFKESTKRRDEIIEGKDGLKAEIKYLEDKVEELEEKNQTQTKFILKKFYGEKIQRIKDCMDINKKELEKWKIDYDDFLQQIENGEIEDDKLIELKVKEFSNQIDIYLKRLDLSLPIYAFKEKIIKSIRKNKILIIEGKPGSGKSTQVPQYLKEIGILNREEGQKKIFVTLPRNIAARNLRDRVAEELNIPDESSSVYYCTATSVNQEKLKHSEIIFCSNFTLYYIITNFKDARKDVGAIMIDEANLRHIYADMMVSIFKKLSDEDKIMRLIILCTKIDAEAYENFFDEDEKTSGLEIIKIPQSNYPIRRIDEGQRVGEKKSGRILNVLRDVETKIERRFSEKRKSKYDIEALNSARSRHVLVFLSSARMINRIFSSIRWLEKKQGGLSHKIPNLQYKLYAAHGATNFSEERGIFEDPDEDHVIKVILSSKVLETSVTIENVGFVVDFGEEKHYTYNSRLKVQETNYNNIDRVTAEQREGRTGRTALGVYYRMYDETIFEDGDSQGGNFESLFHENIDTLTLNFIKMIREDKTNWIFQEKLFKEKISILSEDEDPHLQNVINNITNLDMITRIPENDIKMSLENLKQLQALDKEYKLTSIGKEILAIGIDPKYARIIIEGKKRKILPEILKVVACSQRKSPFRAERFNSDFIKGKTEFAKKFVKHGDYAANFTIFEEFLEIKSNEKQRKFCKENGYDFGTLKQSSENFRYYKRICKKIFQGVSKESWKKSTKRSEEESNTLFKLINKCLLSGFFDKTSSLINKNIGYFCHKGGFITKIHNSSIYSFKNIETSDLPELMTSAEVSKDEKFKSKWLFPIELSWVKEIDRKMYKKIKKNIKNGVVQQRVIERILPSRFLSFIHSKSWIFKYFLNGKKADLHILDKRKFLLQVASSEGDFEEVEEIIDEFLSYLERKFKNTTFEHRIKNFGKVMLGDGLRIKNLLSFGKFKGFYLRNLPRAFINKDRKFWANLSLFGEKFLQLKNLVKNKWFTIEAINNDQNKKSDSLYSTLKMNFEDYKLAQKAKNKVQDFIDYFSQNKKLQEKLQVDGSRLKIHLFNKGEIISKAKSKINLLFRFSETKNKGRCKIVFYKHEDMEHCINILQNEICKGKSELFGKYVTLTGSPVQRRKSKKKEIFLDGLVNHIDEKFIIKNIEKMFEESEEFVLYENIKVYMEKEPKLEDSELLVRWKNQIENKIIKPYTKEEIEDFKLSIQNYNYFIKSRYEKRFTNMRCIEFQIDNIQAAKDIKRKFDMQKGIITNRIIHIEIDENYLVFITKRKYKMMKPLLETLNQEIESYLMKKYHSSSIGSNNAVFLKERSFIQFQNEEYIEEKEDNDFVRLRVIQGSDKKLSTKLIGALSEFVTGDVIHIREKCTNEMFGDEGDVLKNRIQSEHKFTIIDKLPYKNIWIVHSIGFDKKKNLKKSELIREEILEEMEKLSKKETKNFRYILSGDQVTCLLDHIGKGVKLEEGFLMEGEDRKEKTYVELLEFLLKKATDDLSIVIKCHVSRVEQSLKISHKRNGYREMKTLVGDQIKKLKEIWNENNDQRGKEQDGLEWMSDDEDREEGKEEVETKEQNTCEICSDRRFLNKLLNCEHVFCRQCLHNHITKKIELLETEEFGKMNDLNQSVLFCPSEGCGCDLNINDIFEIIVEDKVHVLLEKSIRFMIKSGKIQGFWKCQRKDCGEFMEYEEGDKKVYCRCCNIEYCRECSAEYESDMHECDDELNQTLIN